MDNLSGRGVAGDVCNPPCGESGGNLIVTGCGAGRPEAEIARSAAGSSGKSAR